MPLATAYAYAQTPTPRAFRHAPATAPRVTAGARDGTAPVRELMLPAGTPIGNGWVLRLPLLYELRRGEKGILSDAAALGAYGYGDSGTLAIQSLLDGMVDVLESLNNMQDDQLDRSAKGLRDLLREQFRQPAQSAP